MRQILSSITHPNVSNYMTTDTSQNRTQILSRSDIALTSPG